jgi:hypothetical protein
MNDKITQLTAERDRLNEQLVIAIDIIDKMAQFDPNNPDFAIVRKGGAMMTIHHRWVANRLGGK